MVIFLGDFAESGLSACLSVCVSVCLSVCLSVFLSVYMSVYMAIFCMSVRLSVCQSFSLSDSFSERLQELMTYPHQWVRLAGAQLLGHLLSGQDYRNVLSPNFSCSAFGNNPRIKV